MVSVTPDADGFVKEDVGSLLAKTVYFYRFTQGGDTSAVGRVVTTPDPSDATRVVHLGWTGDSNAFNRPFTSLDPIRLLAPDGWFYIGDTIYGDDPLADGLVAMTQPDYESKYRENRSDAALRGLMESTGTYSQWDDHEVRNDFAGAEPVFATRMAAGNAAFRRYMPLREDPMDAMQLYRSVRWGSGAEFFIIDDRQYRTAKYTCCTNDPDSGFVTTDADSTCMGGSAGEATFPSSNCNTQMSGAGRSILGATQKAWLKAGLLGSTATFKFIMNGPPIAQFLFLPYDRWEAWSAERTEILDYITTNSIKNVVWLSTDLHAIVISPDHLDVAGTHPTPEIVAGAIGESTIFRELPPSVVASLPGLPGVVTEVSEFELDRYNVVLITIDPSLATPRASFDFYDRSGSIIHSVFFDAVP
jgi:alkaline phosphatase D